MTAGNKMAQMRLVLPQPAEGFRNVSEHVVATTCPRASVTGTTHVFHIPIIGECTMAVSDLSDFQTVILRHRSPWKAREDIIEPHH